MSTGIAGGCLFNKRQKRQRVAPLTLLLEMIKPLRQKLFCRLPSQGRQDSFPQTPAALLSGVPARHGRDGGVFLGRFLRRLRYGFRRWLRLPGRLGHDRHERGARAFQKLLAHGLRAGAVREIRRRVPPRTELRGIAGRIPLRPRRGVGAGGCVRLSRAAPCAVERGGVSRGRLLRGGRARGASGKHAHRARDGRARAGPGAGANAGSHTGADGGTCQGKPLRLARGEPAPLIGELRGFAENYLASPDLGGGKKVFDGGVLSFQAKASAGQPADAFAVC